MDGFFHLWFPKGTLVKQCTAYIFMVYLPSVSYPLPPLPSPPAHVKHLYLTYSLRCNPPTGLLLFL